MDLPATTFVAFGAVVAALITGIFSFVSLINTKEQKTSEFRQLWIDGLRDDSAKLLGILEAISTALQLAIRLHKINDENNKKDIKVAWLDICNGSLSEFGEVYHRIILRLNPSEHHDLIVLLKEVQDKLHSDSEMLKNKEELRIRISALINELHSINAFEWSRVKKGEAAYRVTKYLAMIMIVVILAFSYTAYSEFTENSKTTPNNQVNKDASR